MENYKPSQNFTSRVMQDVRVYEAETGRERKHVDAFLLSRPVFSVLAAGGILFGIINLVRMALIVIAPATCL
jgi:hypothetical protein